MTVPPYLVAAMVMVSFSLSSDKCQNRGTFMTVASLIGALGYLSVSLHFHSALRALITDHFLQNTATNAERDTP